MYKVFLYLIFMFEMNKENNNYFYLVWYFIGMWFSYNLWFFFWNYLIGKEILVKKWFVVIVLFLWNRVLWSWVYNKIKKKYGKMYKVFLCLCFMCEMNKENNNFLLIFYCYFNFFSFLLFVVFILKLFEWSIC